MTPQQAEAHAYASAAVACHAAAATTCEVRGCKRRFATTCGLAAHFIRHVDKTKTPVVTK